MKLYIISKQSFKAIFTNKGRSFLTILGIVIGIGSVIALMSLGNGVKANISGQIATLGTTTLTIMPGEGFAAAENANNTPSNKNTPAQSAQQSRGGGVMGSASTLTIKDLESLNNKSDVPDVDLVAGSVSGSAIYGDQRFSVNGTGPSLFQIRKRDIDKGSNFTENDVTDKNKVLVLGADLAVNLFSEKDPIGQEMTIGKDVYKVIGVFQKAEGNNFNNPNLLAYIPYTSAMQSLDTDKFSNLSATAKDENSVNAAKDEIEKVLLKNHNITNKKLADFSVSSSADLLSAVGNITGVLTSLLSGIAAISLLVGGIGIMNIMLVSVTERTREIGLRKAVGARTSDILAQFLVEAVMLTLTGGVIGILLGITMAKIAGRFVGFPPVTTNNAIWLAVGISTLVGLVFGIYPAAKAAKLNPIDALRYE